MQLYLSLTKALISFVRFRIWFQLCLMDVQACCFFFFPLHWNCISCCHTHGILIHFFFFLKIFISSTSRILWVVLLFKYVIAFGLKILLFIINIAFFWFSCVSNILIDFWGLSTREDILRRLWWQALQKLIGLELD